MLDELKNGALNVGGGSIIDVSGADIVVNSASRAAAKTAGEARVMVADPGITRVVGQSTGTGFQPKPVHGSDALADWLAGHATPDTAGMPERDDGGDTLMPGVYTGGIEIKGGGVTLLPGVYVLRGGGLTVKGGASLTGSGVTIFNTLDKYPAPGGACGAIEIKESTLSLSAPADGDYAGLAIYQDPACDQKLKWASRSSGEVVGTIYAASAELALESDSRLTATQLVVNRLTVGSDTARLTIAYDRALAAQR